MSRMKPGSPLHTVFLLKAGALLVAVTLYYRFTWPHFGDFLASMDFIEIPFADFVVFYREMGKAILAGGTPVVGYLYSPVTAIILNPFGMLPLTTSTVIWQSGIVLCTAGTGYLSYRLTLPDSRFFSIALFFVMITSFPILHNFSWGQVNALLVFLLLSTLFFYKNGKWAAAAFLLALAASFKYYPVIFVLPFLVRKDWRFAAAFGVWCIVLFVVVPVAVLGKDGTWNFFAHIYEEAYRRQVAAGGVNSQFVANVAARWLSLLGLDEVIPRIVFRTAGLFIVECNLVLSSLLVWSKTPKALTWSFLFLFLSIPFLMATSWPNYFIFLPFCQLAMIVLPRNHGLGITLQQRNILAACVALSAFCATIFVAQLLGGWWEYNRLGLIFVADALLLGGCYFIHIPRLVKQLPRSFAL